MFYTGYISRIMYLNSNDHKRNRLKHYIGSEMKKVWRIDSKKIWLGEVTWMGGYLS